MNLTTPINTLVFNPDSQVCREASVRTYAACSMQRRNSSMRLRQSLPTQILAIGSHHKRECLRLVHLRSHTVFANWPTKVRLVRGCPRARLRICARAACVSACVCVSSCVCVSGCVCVWMRACVSAPNYVAGFQAAGMPVLLCALLRARVIGLVLLGKSFVLERSCGCGRVECMRARACRCAHACAHTIP